MNKKSRICLIWVVLTITIAMPPSVQTIMAFGPGIHIVGTDIEPGIYRTVGEITYFARLSGLSGEFSDIIANNASPPSPTIIEIKAEDIAYHSDIEGMWSIVDESYQPKVRSTFGDGFWFVNVDILPGVYRTEDYVTYCARLSGFGHYFQDIITNKALVTHGAAIEIWESDAGFQTEGGAR